MQALPASMQRLGTAAGAEAVIEAQAVIAAVTAAVVRAEWCGKPGIVADSRLIAQTRGLPAAAPVFRALEVQVWEVQAMAAGTVECRAFSPQRRPRPESFLPSPDATAASR